MDLNAGLPTELNIVNQDYSWVQTLDYDDVSFRCRSCFDIGHLAKSCPKTPQTYRNCKATWWKGARPEHYIVSNDESNTRYDETGDLPANNIFEARPRATEPSLEAETMAATPRKTNEKFYGPKIPYTTATPEFTDWKLVTKKSSGAATFPRGPEGHKGIQQLSFGILEILSLKHTEHTVYA